MELTGDKALEKWLGGEIGIVGLKVLLGWGHKLHGSKLESVGCVSEPSYSLRGVWRYD